MLELVCAKFHSKWSIFHHFRGQNSKNRYQNLKIEFIFGELELVGCIIWVVGYIIWVIGGTVGNVLAEWG